MKISRLNYMHLHNLEHIGFHNNFQRMVNKYGGAAALGIETVYNAYIDIFENEKLASGKRRKNWLTDEMVLADKARKKTFRGMQHAIKATRLHSDPEVKNAADLLSELIFQYVHYKTTSYGTRTYRFETIISVFREDYPNDVANTGIEDWLSRLDADNKTFETKMKERNSQQSGQTDLVLRTERLRVDEAYNKVLSLLSARFIVDGEEKYDNFVKELNAHIETQATSLAMRRGHRIRKARLAAEKAKIATIGQSINHEGLIGVS
jgi:hypothetical protein